MKRQALLVLTLVAAAAVTAGFVLARGGADPPPEAGGPATSEPAAGSSSTSTEPPSSSTTTAPPATTLAPGASVCDPYSVIEVAGTVAATELTETSGIAFGRVNAGVLWAHNDSRGGPVLFALGTDGADLGAFSVAGAFAFDWEDVAAGPGPEPGVSYLFVGDIGDNFAIRDGRVTVFRIVEPDLAGDDPTLTAEPLDLRYPDGSPNAEALFVDPVDAALYVLTRDPASTRVYRADAAAPAGSTQDLELVAVVSPGSHVTGADITRDGSVIALRGERAVWMWYRPPGSSIAEALTADPCSAPSPDERQGESIAFDGDRSYVTISEGTAPPVHRVPSETNG